MSERIIGNDLVSSLIVTFFTVYTEEIVRSIGTKSNYAIDSVSG